MAAEHSHIDLESGTRRHHHHLRPRYHHHYYEPDEVEEEKEEEEEQSLCFSDPEDVDNGSTHSSHSLFYSTTDGYSFSGRRHSSASEHSVIDEDASGGCIIEGKVDVERDCRICHLSLEEEEDEDEDEDGVGGVPIELGCSCKDDLGVAHKRCAEAWFKIKGNKICEICNCTARNVMGINDIEDSAQNPNENGNSAAANGESVSANTNIPAPPETQRFWQGHRFLNFLLACMVFAFVISWLFHFKVPS